MFFTKQATNLPCCLLFMLALVWTGLLFIASPVIAQPAEEDDFGQEWCVITHPNNAPFPGHRSTGRFHGRGSIPYVYRIAKTEVTNAQFLEFLWAYLPFYEDDPTSTDFTGWFIQCWQDGTSDWHIEILSGWEDGPANMSLRQAARYVNWLHNGKANEEWAFHTGVYDATTFGEDEEGNPTDDYTRSPDARVWIPSVDEWLKAAYFDPNSLHPHYPQWWRYPNASNEPPVYYFPEKGGTSNGGLFYWFDGPFLPKGMYPGCFNPWGLLDVSGGLSEITEGYALGSSFLDHEVFCRGWDNAGSYKVDLLRWPHLADFGIGLRFAARVNASPKEVPR